MPQRSTHTLSVHKHQLYSPIVLNAARWAPKITEVIFTVIVMCHGRREAAVIGFSSRIAAQTPPLPQLFTLSTVQIVAAPAHLSLRYS